MRWKNLATALTVIVSAGLASLGRAEATDLHRSYPPAGYGHERVINHHVYYPRYHHVYRVHGTTDPYLYRPGHRGYYPAYNSGYWRPAHEMRHRPQPHYQLPKYYPAWGYTTDRHAVPRSHHGHHAPRSVYSHDIWLW